MQADILEKLAVLIRERRNSDPETSWTAKLLHSGKALAARKLGEEAIETMVEAFEDNPERLAEESADLLYHWLVLMEICGVSPSKVYTILEQRMKDNKQQ